MKKLTFRSAHRVVALLLTLVALQLTSCKKEVFDKDLKREFSVQSTATGAKYQIEVALPVNYDPGGKYATIYVLDGKNDFDYVANQSKEISSQKNKSNVIVVGIGYGNDRSIDYTPSLVKQHGGGGQRFMKFIRTELIPKVEHEFAVDTSRSGRVILGHSYGGLLGTYAFTNFNDVFGNYILLSPSLWYDNEIIFKLEEDSRKVNQSKEQLVFMGLGEFENSGRMAAPFEAFHQKLAVNYAHTKLGKNIVPGLDHVGSKAPNIVKGLNFYFDNK